MAEFLSFEDVLDELMIEEEELKRLISQGELRGFRDGMSMKFKRSDVQNLKQGRNTEPTIILTDSDHDLDIPESSDELLLEDSSADDTVLNISDFMDSGDGLSSDELLIGSEDDLIISSEDSEEAIPTVETPSLSGDESGTIEFYESSSEDDTGALMEVAASSDQGGTEALELLDESSGNMGAVALLDEDSGDWDEGEEDDIAPRSSVSTRAARSSRRAMATAASLQPKTHHIAWTVMLLLSVAILLIPLAIVFNTAKGVEPAWVTDLAKNFNGITEAFYKMFAK